MGSLRSWHASSDASSSRLFRILAVASLVGVSAGPLSFGDSLPTAAAEIPQGSNAEDRPPLPITTTPPPDTPPVCPMEARVVEGYQIGLDKLWQYYGDNSGHIGRHDDSITGLPNHLSAHASSLSCVTSMVKQLEDYAYPAAQRDGKWKYIDDYVSGLATHLLLDKQFTFGNQFNNIGNLECRHHATNDVEAFSKGNRNVFQEQYGFHANCVYSVVYLDDNCNSIDPKTVDASCKDVEDRGGRADIDMYWFLSCPVSLVFGAPEDIEKHVSMVNFPLDPTKPGKAWLWKASASTPLLVFDPSHTGNIQGADQLFGNWTFGGQKLASLNAGAGSPAGGAWKNGFDALKTLDSNHDGRISGEELKPLGLWFDANQDGVSQPGEVKTLADVGVTALFFEGDKVDPITGNIQATVGYERVVDGKVVKGTSIDWFTKGANSQNDLYSREFLNGQPPVTSERPTASHESQTSAISHSTSLRGIWAWRFNDSRIKSSKNDTVGYLIFDENADGSVSGSSIVETKIGGNLKGSVVTQLRFSVNKEVTADGGPAIRFAMAQDNGATMENVATLSADGQALEGTTVASVKQSDKTVKYRWVATRLGK